MFGAGKSKSPNNNSETEEEPPVPLTQSTSDSVPKQDLINISIKTITGQDIPITISKWAKVKQLKRCIQREKPNFKLQGMTLLYKNKELSEKVVLDHEGVLDGSSLNLLIKMTTSVLHESPDSDASDRSDRDDTAEIVIDENQMRAIESGIAGQQTLTLILGSGTGEAMTVLLQPAVFDELQPLYPDVPPNMFIPNDVMTPAELARYKDVCSSWNQLDDVRQYSNIAESWDKIDAIKAANKSKQCPACDKRLDRADSRYECKLCAKILCSDDAPHSVHAKYFAKTNK